MAKTIKIGDSEVEISKIKSIEINWFARKDHETNPDILPIYVDQYRILGQDGESLLNEQLEDYQLYELAALIEQDKYLKSTSLFTVYGLAR